MFPSTNQQYGIYVVVVDIQKKACNHSMPVIFMVTAK